MSSLKRAAAIVVLLVVFVVAFSLSGQAMVPADLVSTDAPGPRALLGLGVMALVDVAFIVGVVLTSRLRGPRLWLLVATVYWGAKTFTGQLEAWYFMPNVDGALALRLMLMTAPVAVVVPLLAVLLLGKWSGVEDYPSVRVPPMGAAQQAWKWALLGGVVYPVLFFVAGYFIAFASDDVRAFYGGVLGDSFAGHLRALVRNDPLLLPFEMFRGVLWVAMAAALLWTTRGPTWAGGGWALLLFTLVQNDVHLLPNPLMPPTVQLFHFLETVPSNGLFAVLITLLLHRAHHAHPRALPPHLSHA